MHENREARNALCASHGSRKLEFPTYEEAKGWYRPEQQAACQQRFQGGDYRFILTDGGAAK